MSLSSKALGYTRLTGLLYKVLLTELFGQPAGAFLWQLCSDSHPWQKRAAAFVFAASQMFSFSWYQDISSQLAYANPSVPWNLAIWTLSFQRQRVAPVTHCSSMQDLLVVKSNPRWRLSFAQICQTHCKCRNLRKLLTEGGIRTENKYCSKTHDEGQAVMHSKFVQQICDSQLITIVLKHELLQKGKPLTRKTLKWCMQSCLVLCISLRHAQSQSIEGAAIMPYKAVPDIPRACPLCSALHLQAFSTDVYAKCLAHQQEVHCSM